MVTTHVLGVILSEGSRFRNHATQTPL